MYDGLKIAQYAINWHLNNDKPITNLRLQKILYFLQGDYCAISGGRLISDEFYAWQLGPVIPSVYDKFSVYASMDLPKQPDIVINDLEDKDMIDEILENYSRYTTWELVGISHKQDPWKYNYEMFGNRSIIPYKSIENYFKAGE